MIFFCDQISIRWISEAELAPFGDWDVLFLNANTPSDLERARRLAELVDGGDRRPRKSA